MSQPRPVLVSAAVAIAMTVMAIERPISADQGSSHPDFRQKVEALLTTYIAHKKYQGETPQSLEAKMSTDRLAALHSIVWATFLPLTPKAGGNVPPGTRVKDLVEALYGIWGVRVNNSEGKLQFRLSVKLSPKAVDVLKASNEFSHHIWFCHVLLPGDDDSQDPQSTQFASGADCFRGLLAPKLQISYDERDHTTAEIDLDYDTGSCHTTPGNSDARQHFENAGFSEHAGLRHLELLNQSYNHLGTALSLSCQLSPRFHCRDSYADRNCP